MNARTLLRAAGHTLIFQALIAAAILIVAYFSLNPPLGGRPPTLMLVLAIMVAAFINFHTLHITVTDQRLTVGYGLIKTRVPTPTSPTPRP